MGALTDLGITSADAPILCIAAPDSVLAEAGAMRPRPTFAPSVFTARPAARIVWWPDLHEFEAHALRRLHWLVEIAGTNDAWLILDPADPSSPPEDSARLALNGAGLAAGPSRIIGRGEIALPVAVA